LTSRQLVNIEQRTLKNIMRTITTVISAFILLITQLVTAQSKSDKMYDAFANKDGISSFTFSRI